MFETEAASASGFNSPTPEGSNGRDDIPEYFEFFEALDGTFTIKAEKEGVSHSANQGKCFFMKTELEDGKHPIYGYKANSCQNSSD